MDVRVRLVFADELGRHVLRRRGFSSCWYLVPTDAKLVGDLAHALLREFELRRRCPKGLELRLQELPLLATQSIRLVRDDDTIVVQCPPLEYGASDSERASSSESEEETVAKLKPTQRKRKLKLEQKKKPERKIKRARPALKETKRRINVDSKPRENGAGKGAAAAKKEESSSSSSRSSSSSSSSSESDSSSSSESESSSRAEDESSAQQNRKRATTAATARPAKARVAASAKSSASNGVVGNADAPAKEPRRRRRRLRQRNGRRQRNGDQVNEVASQASPSGSNAAISKVPGRAEDQPTEASATRVSNSNAGLRGFPRAKAHVLFDEVTGDQVAVQHDDNLPHENTRATRHPQAPELAKYGPSRAENLLSSRDSQVRSSTLSNGLQNGESNGNSDAPKRKGKGKYEEMWKRPYEIVATVLDGNAGKSDSSTEDLTKSLDSYPTTTTGSCGFKPTDVLAYKTLTLCLETWQPVLSEWQCGQVLSVEASGNSVELLKWAFEIDGDSVSFNEAPGGEQCTVQTSEISELRFLSGPSYLSLTANR